VVLSKRVDIVGGPNHLVRATNGQGLARNGGGGKLEIRVTLIVGRVVRSTFGRAHFGPESVRRDVERSHCFKSKRAKQCFY
jgi:hypothetical protein